MNKKDALENFKEFYLVKYDDDGRKIDKIAIALEWTIYTDSLCKNGHITQKQYSNWSNPYS